MGIEFNPPIISKTDDLANFLAGVTCGILAGIAPGVLVGIAPGTLMGPLALEAKL